MATDQGSQQTAKHSDTVAVSARLFLMALDSMDVGIGGVASFAVLILLLLPQAQWKEDAPEDLIRLLCVCVRAVQQTCLASLCFVPLWQKPKFYT